jgi:hypothetical protein
MEGIQRLYEDRVPCRRRAVSNTKSIQLASCPTKFSINYCISEIKTVWIDTVLH